jgi:hypothetical protein
VPLLLKDSPNGVLSKRDELSGFFGAMDKYAAGRGAAADRAFWLTAFNGGEYVSDRIGRGSCYIPNLGKHYGHSAADGRDQGIVKVGKNSSRRHFV